ncbi:hypothetical protein [Falsihalocynthiibacter sp. CO-5D18]|uniref:hypothetical protein n=1 Tax=Falsihalocynthiibacter sp. CO-5D18 TaxID=3240872 RepID=UPI00350ED872
MLSILLATTVYWDSCEMHWETVHDDGVLAVEWMGPPEQMREDVLVNGDDIAFAASPNVTLRVGKTVVRYDDKYINTQSLDRDGDTYIFTEVRDDFGTDVWTGKIVCDE